MKIWVQRKNSQLNAFVFLESHGYILSAFWGNADIYVVLWSPLLSFKLGCPGSSLGGRTSTQGLNIIEEKGLPVQWYQ